MRANSRSRSKSASKIIVNRPRRRGRNRGSYNLIQRQPTAFNKKGIFHTQAMFSSAV